MPKVIVQTAFPHWPLVRQTPSSLGRWGDYEFVIDSADTQGDALVVVENPEQPIRANCPPENTVFVTCEPPEIRKYNNRFADQFAWVVSCHEFRHRGLIRSQQGHPWFVGVDAEDDFRAVFNYDSLPEIESIEKPYVMSTVISSKAVTPAHKQRLAFAKRLKERLGDRFHLLGRGHKLVDDKWDAVAPYRFHLAMENAVHPNYMTEKIVDAFLGGAFPVYFGCPNVADYLPEGSFLAIDIFDTDRAIQQVCDAIDQNLDLQQRAMVAESRTIIRDELNLFAMLSRLLDEKMIEAPRKPITILPKNHHVRLTLGSLARSVVGRRAAA